MIIRATTRFATRIARTRLNQPCGSVIDAVGRISRTPTATVPCSSAMATLKTAFAGAYDCRTSSTDRPSTQASVAHRPPTSTRAMVSASSANDQE